MAVNQNLPIGRDSNVQDTFSHGSKSVGTSAVQLIAANTPANVGVLVKANSTNAGIVYVGNSSNVTAGTSTPGTDGFELTASESVFVEVNNANEVYLIASEASQVVHFVVT